MYVEISLISFGRRAGLYHPPEKRANRHHVGTLNESRATY
jgi:hypothetical protein